MPNDTYGLEAYITNTNIAKELEGDLLKDMGVTVFDGYNIDEGSREEWLVKNDDYLKLATQVADKKSFPWRNASNIKYPLLTIASLQFAARAYQTLFPNANIVKSRVVGDDPQGVKAAKAYRISKYMSYQLLEEDDTWEDSMDRLCIILPIIGNVFKKTYYCQGKNVSEMILPKDLVINYYAKSLEDASRITHILYYYPNAVEEKIRSGDFLTHEYLRNDTGPLETLPQNTIEFDGKGLEPPSNDPDTPIVYLEQHRLWDLDEDGYEEPYIITIHKDTKEVVRVVARYDQNSVETNEDGEVSKITPIQYFTNFIFIPDPTSGVYGLGFGSLLGPLNEAANTLINQLVDSGTLNNLQSGFIGRGIRIPGGNTPLAPGEWRFLQTSGDKLKDNIVPLPTKEPSQVLFTLLGMMVESGFNIGSISETMLGKNPGQNQPFSTTSEVLKQGEQVFSAIHKRIHRALKKEFRKLYRLNKLYLTADKYFTVLDPKTKNESQNTISPEDFNNDKDFDVFPASDPTQLSSVERLEKAQLLLNLLPTGQINPKEAIRRILEGARIDDIEEVMNAPPPQPNFDQQIELKRLELEGKQLEISQIKTQYQAARDEANSMLAIAKAAAEKANSETAALKVKFDALLQEAELKLQGINANLDRKMDLVKEQNKLVIEKSKAVKQKQKSSSEKK